SELRSALSVPPPHIGKTAGPIARQKLRPGETVPTRGPVLPQVIERDNEVVPQQHAVERAGGSNQFLASLGKDDTLDQRIARGVLDAELILRAGRSGRVRAPEVPLLFARRKGLSPQSENDVEIELPQAVFVLGEVDRAQRYVDSEPLQIVRPVEQADALVGRVLGIEQDFDAHLLAGLGIDELGGAWLVAGPAQ